MVTTKVRSLTYLISTHLKLCLSIATHNLKWVTILISVYFETKNVQICVFKTVISFSVTEI